MESEEYMKELNTRLRKGWSAHLSTEGRIYYMNHETKLSSWLPPVESWEGNGLPYGWESAIDKDGKTYYINHPNRTTTLSSPVRRRGDGCEEEESPREVVLVRDPHHGFGFVAGSEKPVIVRFVTEGGPNEKKLMPGDQILKINGEDVMRSPREHVIELIRSCKQTVNLLVCQPQTNNTTRKSALLTAAKKAKLKNHPSRVRFSEGVTINGSPLSPADAPFLPNVLKVFLENGQTKSFKYDTTTTVQDVLNSLFEKLSIKCAHHFCLATEHVKITRKNRLTILDPKQLLAKIASRPGAHHLRCVLRASFVPRDAQELLKTDPVTFEYLYMQCCNDIVEERFVPELKYEVALRLTAVHMQQHCLTTGVAGKATLKAVERACGLERFVPASLLESMRGKELRRLLSHFLKAAHKIPSPVHAKLYLLRSVAEAPAYGAKTFPTNITDSNPEMTVLVSPRFGISQISRGATPVPLCRTEEVTSVEVQREDEWSCLLHIHTRDAPSARQVLSLSLEEKDADEFVLMLEGYHRLQTGGGRLEVVRHTPPHSDAHHETVAPLFHSRHLVHESPWSYPPPAAPPGVRTLDLTTLPPPYVPPCELPRLSPKPRPYDHNMNVRLRPHSADSPPPPPRSRRSSVDERHPGVDYRTAISMELLLLDAAADVDVDVHEARNEELIRRMADVERMVSDAHLYLGGSPARVPIPTHPNQEDGEVTTTTANDDEEEEDEEEALDEDDECPSSPSSPLRPRRSSSSALNRPLLMRRDSSFGLHSPDLLPPEVSGEGILDILRDMREEEEREAAVCLDPDLIDLTALIPPPDTPTEGEEGGEEVTPVVDPPPGLFFDGTPADGAFSLSLDSLLSTLATPTEAEEEEEDLSAFIIPPPPASSPGSHEAQEAVLARFVAAAEDIAAFLRRPPPPAEADSASSSSSSGYDTVPSSCDDSSSSVVQVEEECRVVPAYVSTSCVEAGGGPLSPSSTASSSDSSQRVASCGDLLDTGGPAAEKGGVCLEVPGHALVRSASWGSLDVEEEESTFNTSASLRQNRLRRSFHRPKNIPREALPPSNGPASNNSKPLPQVSSHPINGTKPLHPLNGRPINGQGPTPSTEQTIRDLASLVIRLRQSPRGTASPVQSEAERAKISAARDVLASESRRFVSASKLFVRGAMDEADPDPEGAALCVALLGRMTAVGEALAPRDPTASRLLLEGLEAVALSFLRTVEAAREAGKARLMHCATQLATALTALMRTLRAIGTPSDT